MSYLMQFFQFSNSQPNEPHLLIHRDIYLCEDAPNSKSQRTCETMTGFMSEDTVTEVGASRADGPCPVCTAAERAVQETSFQTDYVSYPTFNNHMCS
jgi:hypothetical protein